VLVLDEPTNDLDIETLELLEELLQTYEGTLFLVSHDRTFLDNVVTQTIAAEGEGLEGIRRRLQRLGVVPGQPGQGGGQQGEGRGQAGRQSGRGAQSQGRQAVVEGAARTGGTARQDAALEGEQADLSRLLEDPAIYQRDARRRRKRPNGWPPSTMNSCSAWSGGKRWSHASGNCG
jgi:ATP-binding cassette subfamily F protein uup